MEQTKIDVQTAFLFEKNELKRTVMPRLWHVLPLMEHRKLSGQS